ncbi:MAG: M20 family metallopeptidase [Flavitalea sp.]
MSTLKEKIQERAALYASSFIEVRHHLHAHPELSYHEFLTSEYVQKQLDSFGIEYKLMGGTGVIGLIKGKNPNKRVIALRADMDALPIEEANDVPYKSQNKGIMHACGHDVHTTCLLGAARILNELKEEWEGTVKLIFQPGEERNPGGASILIKEGVLKNPAPTSIFGLHVHSGLQAGKLSFRPGKVMASADELYFTIKGNGGHAAAPHLTVDTILVASQIIVALQQVISRNNDPFTPSVLSICAIQGGHTTNVIPNEVKLMGTFRALDETWRFKAHTLIKRIAESTATGMGATIDVKVDVGYPAVMNNEALYVVARKLAEDYLGEENIETTEMRMGAEDFGYYSHEIPGCFYRLGIGNIAKGITAGVHTPNFNIDESAITYGVQMMAWLGAMTEF